MFTGFVAGAKNFAMNLSALVGLSIVVFTATLPDTTPITSAQYKAVVLKDKLFFSVDIAKDATYGGQLVLYVGNDYLGTLPIPQIGHRVTTATYILPPAAVNKSSLTLNAYWTNQTLDVYDLSIRDISKDTSNNSRSNQMKKIILFLGFLAVAFAAFAEEKKVCIDFNGISYCEVVTIIKIGDTEIPIKNPLDLLDSIRPAAVENIGLWDHYTYPAVITELAKQLDLTEDTLIITLKDADVNWKALHELNS